MLMEDSLASYEAGLEALSEAPARALDLGTGAGEGAVAIARRFPEADVVGADLSPSMLDEAWRLLLDQLRGRDTFPQAAASALSFPEDSFKLVANAKMCPSSDAL